AVLALAGCVPRVEKPPQICPGKEDVSASLSLLEARAENAVAVKAKGRCRLRLYVDGESKPHKENLTLKFWFDPPADIYLQGDASLIPKAIVFGSNEDEFWLGIRPKEVSTYWWGAWDEQDSLHGLPLRPKILLEALGTVELGDDYNWSLSNEGPFDVLTRRSEEGAVVKRVYVYNCEERVSRTEYFDDDGEVMFTAELGKYKKVSEAFSVPTLIEIVKSGQEGREDSVRISINTAKMVEFTEKARDRLFTRPEPRGFRHVIRIVDGKPIEQAQ
ncbi:MAG: LolA-like protein, partial [Planctomycetota bacterium]